MNIIPYLNQIFSIYYIQNFQHSINTVYFFFLLATKPSKKTSTCVLIINIILTIPDVIVGSRGNLILSCFFALFIISIEIIVEISKRWLGKRKNIY